MRLERLGGGPPYQQGLEGGGGERDRDTGRETEMDAEEEGGGGGREGGGGKEGEEG